MSHTQRRAALEGLLLGHAGLWRPQPFKHETPAWCLANPELAAALLALTDAEVERLNADTARLIEWLQPFLPGIGELEALLDLPHLADRHCTQADADDRFFRDVPGRKRAQIEHYAAAMGAPMATVLEWCAGKGHLGRLLSERWQIDVHSLELDPLLCQAGSDLAHQAGLDERQRFLAADALAPASASHLAGRHAIALHACGDLHRALLSAAVHQASPALDLAPCCYYRTRDAHYQPLSGGSLRLSRDDLRLAVTETATASAAERRRSQQAMAWKLGWVALRQALTGVPYRTFKPVPTAWLRGSFPDFIAHMAAREGICLAREVQLDAYEIAGQQRAQRARRLELVRLAFRRALEVWLVMDMACFLERHGYAVRVGTFCPDSLTPRNLLISARQAQGSRASAVHHPRHAATPDPWPARTAPASTTRTAPTAR